jgi:hypothetical protein
MEEILNLEIGKGRDCKLGMSTRFIERIDDNIFHIHDTSSGWLISKVDKSTLDKVLKGELSLLDLDWF